MDGTGDQKVLYVDISRESAADILTVRRMLHTIKNMLRPGSPGCPRFIVVAGDQPSYKMLVELWLGSWREAQSNTAGIHRDSGTTLLLHEWLIPFPGFFHAEKQAMYSLCKELLHGIGLHELAQYAGLSAAHVTNILKQGHARNNRALLFSLTCAMVIHNVDIVSEENPDVQRALEKFYAAHSASRRVVSDPCNICPSATTSFRGRFFDNHYFLGKLAPNVSEDVVNIGSRVRKAVFSQLCEGPNGTHFVGTVLFRALLLTFGFHVLSRTGHTDVTEVFWFRLTYILHGSNHLKYQELALFYAFIRGILPPVVVTELHEDTPGSSFMKLPSFTSGQFDGFDKLGWTYVYQEEGLEMLIVRNVKALSVNLFSHLENAAAWLLPVSRFRALLRRMTGASRLYGRQRSADKAGEHLGPLAHYDRNAPHSRSVAAMLLLMRERGFLNVEHRGSEGITKLFCNPPVRMNNLVDQEKLLNIQEHGRVTTALHSSVLFPECPLGIVHQTVDYHKRTELPTSEEKSLRSVQQVVEYRLLPNPCRSMVGRLQSLMTIFRI